MANLNKPGSGRDLLNKVSKHPALKAQESKVQQKLAEFKAKQQAELKNRSPN